MYFVNTFDVCQALQQKVSKLESLPICSTQSRNLRNLGIARMISGLCNNPAPSHNCAKCYCAILRLRRHVLLLVCNCDWQLAILTDQYVHNQQEWMVVTRETVQALFVQQ